MRDIGIDLGTTNVLIYIKDKGVVLNEPSVVSIDNDTKKVLAVGREAKEMLGRSPEKVKVIEPIKDGVIADFDITEEMLNCFLKKAVGKKMVSKPRILICCPSNITGVEKNAIREMAERLGARQIYMVRDGWTVRTRDGKCAAHFEHTVAVNQGKADILSSFEYIEQVLGDKAI